MSYRDIDRADEALREALLEAFPDLKREKAPYPIEALADAFKALAEAVARDSADREARRGEYHPDY